MAIAPLPGPHYSSQSKAAGSKPCPETQGMHKRVGGRRRNSSFSCMRPWDPDNIWFLQAPATTQCPWLIGFPCCPHGRPSLQSVGDVWSPVHLLGVGIFSHLSSEWSEPSFGRSAFRSGAELDGSSPGLGYGSCLIYSRELSSNFPVQGHFRIFLGL